MHADVVSTLWTDYRSREIIRDLHPNDHMFNAAVQGWTDYMGVGVSAVQIICSALLTGPAYHLEKVLDFGCGHGRVARHLRAFLPKAELYFADIDETGSRFCADTFAGNYVQSHHDFDQLDLPKDLDLIWVGSVFTHLDYGRMNKLFNALIGALRPRGTLIATFRGESQYRRALQETDPNQRRKWKSLIDQYEAGGIGFGSYGIADDPEWGLSLSSINSVIGMGKRLPNVRLVSYSEIGWAAAHDVAAWSISPV
ncbi:class I SAM-dependent methyltransferase [Bradyrhizobium sp. BR 1432]|uniref:class I SAM-dependent methyltransferase n=1 Tax=Bradyrhizobium sp. BR 1432 TaxID=3447966 RepID=UPI003EE755BE